jgi:hypothetical protein
MATAAMPDVLYRMVGDFGWRYRAYQNGVKQTELRARPFE